MYAVVGAGHPVHLDGLEGVGVTPAALRTVEAGPLRAVVGEAPDGLRPKRRDLLAHQAVQERLMNDGTVLPMRFGLTAPDEGTVVTALNDRRAEYLQRLEELEGCAEYHLKAAVDEDELLRRILSDNPPARELNDRIRAGDQGPDLPLALGELVAGEVQARHEALAAGIMGALQPFALRDLATPPTGTDFLNVSFLVAEDRRAAFLAAEKKLFADFGDDIDGRLHGPLPPYSFV
ncbi:GvpL/GvpF family gas vesicle protein [Kitasatospora paranensis]